MDFESIQRLGLDYIKNIDLDKSEEIYNPTTNNHIILLRLLKEKNIICSHCGQVNSSIARNMKSQNFNYSSGLENNITIILKRRIYQCNCGRTFREKNPFVSTKQKITIQKEYKILEALKDINKTYSSVAEEFDISTTSVMNIFDKKVSIPRGKFTDVLCVDEVYSKKFAYRKYCFITYSPQTDKILDVLNSRRKDDLIEYFLRIPIKERDTVKYFSMDLYDVYRQVAKKCFPKAKICADHFHVVKNLTDLFNKARIRIMKKYTHLKYEKHTYYWLYKKYWKLLLKNPDKLKYKKFKVNKFNMYLDEHQIVDYMLSIDKDLKDGYELMVEYKNFNATATSDDVKYELDKIKVKFQNSELPELRKFYRIIKSWHQEIINSFDKINGHIISNGGLERANRDVKTLIRNGYGLSNFNRTRNRIMYVKNKNESVKYTRKK